MCSSSNFKILALFSKSMLTQNYQSEQIYYNCKLCNYNCSDKSNYNKHLNTIKHKNTANTTANTTTTITTTTNTKYECKCGKKYRHCASLSRHKSSCKKNESNESIILGLIAQNKELMTLLTSQQQQHKEETQCLFKTFREHSVNIQQTINEIIPKVGNTTNTTNNNNNQFNLQVFLNEDCKDALNFSEFLEQIQVSFEDLENQAENGYIKGISKLFIESLRELGQDKRPIHCSDKKRKTLYIKENNEWDKEGSLDILKKGINEVTKRTLQTLMKEKQNNADEYKDGDSEFSMKCLNIQRNLFPSADRETTIGKVIENITQSSGIINYKN